MHLGPGLPRLAGHGGGAAACQAGRAIPRPCLLPSSLGAAFLALPRARGQLAGCARGAETPSSQPPGVPVSRLVATSL